MTNYELEQKLSKLNTMQENKETRPIIYSEKLIDEVISMASQLQKDDLMHINVLTQLKQAVDNEIELQQIMCTSVLFYSVVLLKETKVKLIKSRCLDLLQHLCQTDRIVQNMIHIHQVLKIIVELADELYNDLKEDALEYTEEMIDYQQQLGKLVFMMQTCSLKGESKISQASLSVYFSTLTKNIYQCHLAENTQHLLSINFAVLEKICSRKQEAQFIITEYSLDMLCCQILEDQLNLLNEDKEMSVTEEVLLLVLNFMATLCVKVPENGINLLQTLLLQTLLGLIEKDVSDEITKFSLSCFVEVLYANKGKKYSGLLQSLRSIQNIPLDQMIAKVVSFGRGHRDSETIGIWSVLIKMIASVPKKDTYVTELMINYNVLSICMNLLLEKDLSLSTKSQILDALDMIMRIPTLPRQALLNEVSNLINVLLRQKREYQSKRNRNAENYAEYVELTEKARSVLEKLGHTEGRDNKKYQMYTLLVVGVAMLLGGIISYPFKR